MLQDREFYEAQAEICARAAQASNLPREGDKFELARDTWLNLAQSDPAGTEPNSEPARFEHLDADRTILLPMWANRLSLAGVVTDRSIVTCQDCGRIIGTMVDFKQRVPETVIARAADSTYVLLCAAKGCDGGGWPPPGRGHPREDLTVTNRPPESLARS